MNDTLAPNAQSVNVSPATTRPWWQVRPPLLTALAVLLVLFTTLSQRSVQRWVATDLPVDDTVMLRLAGYEPPAD